MWLTTALLLTSPAALAAPAPLIVWLDAVDDAITAAGSDASKLAELGKTWTEEGSIDAAQKAFQAALAIDDNHAAAHEGLGHHPYEGKWYATYSELAKVMRDDAKRRLKADGTVRFGDVWIPIAELPFHRMGWEQLAGGTWGAPGAKAQAADDKQKEADGWQRQHTTWIAPSEFEPWRKGLFKVGDEWLSAEGANAAHAAINSWWQIPGEHYVALTTVSEEDSRWVLWWADQTHAELSRIFGLTPNEKPEFVVLNGIAQYNDFAAGNAAEQRNPADASGHSSVHYAFFTDGWTVNLPGSQTPQFKGAGAAYYDVQDPNLKAFGQHAIRHAAALSWMESVDPSWDAVSRMVTSPTGGFPDRSFWAEKRIPRWLRYGAAAYCERFFEDKNVGEGGDPMWARTWAKDNLKKAGSLDPIDDILALQFNTSEVDATTRLIHEAGLLVHFLVDGSDKKVGKAWQAYRAALVAGEDVATPLDTLEAALRKAEKQIAAFAAK